MNLIDTELAIGVLRQQVAVLQPELAAAEAAVAPKRAALTQLNQELHFARARWRSALRQRQEAVSAAELQEGERAIAEAANEIRSLEAKQRAAASAFDAVASPCGVLRARVRRLERAAGLRPKLLTPSPLNISPASTGEWVLTPATRIEVAQQRARQQSGKVDVIEPIGRIEFKNAPAAKGPA